MRMVSQQQDLLSVLYNMIVVLLLFITTSVIVMQQQHHHHHQPMIVVVDGWMIHPTTTLSTRIVIRYNNNNNNNKIQNSITNYNKYCVREKSSHPSSIVCLQLQKSDSDNTETDKDVSDISTTLVSSSVSNNNSNINDNNNENNVDTTTTTNNNNNNNTWIWTVVLPLWLVYISNQWSRSSIYYLVNFDTTASTETTTATSLLAKTTAMNVDIGFDQTQYGILASVAFTSLFAISSLCAGYISDRYNRKIITCIAVLGWTIATYGTATSTTYETIVLWRIAMGLACAFSTPTAYTYIRDMVPKTRQATASSLYGTGVALGSGLASYTLVLDNTYGWRQALYIIAGAGIIATVLVVTLLPNDNNKSTLPESTSSLQLTASNEEVSDDKPIFESIINDIQLSFETDRVRWIFLGSFVRFCSGLCIGVWGAPYFRMTFADHVNDYAYTQAAISAIGASVSGIAGGAIADQLSSSTVNTNNNVSNMEERTMTQYDLIGRRLWVPMVGSLLAAPTWYMAMHTPDSFETSMIWLASEYVVAECWFGPTISALQSTVTTKVGGTAQGIFTLTGAIANFAPSILGYFYGQAISTGIQGNEGSSSLELANLLSWAVCFGYIANAFCFGMAATAKPPTSIDNTLKK